MDHAPHLSNHDFLRVASPQCEGRPRTEAPLVGEQVSETEKVYRGRTPEAASVPDLIGSPKPLFVFPEAPRGFASRARASGRQRICTAAGQAAGDVYGSPVIGSGFIVLQQKPCTR